MKLEKLLKNFRTIGVCGNANSAKSSLVYVKLIELKENYPNFPIYIFGVEDNLVKYLESKGIQILHNKEDVLDLKIVGSLIFIDEFADVFSVQSKDKQLDRIKRFFNRIYHLNNWVIISTAQASFWNKFICGLITCYMVKEIEYDKLVNGTVLKRKVLGLNSNSDYRFECPKGEYYVFTEYLTEKCKFSYDKNLDSKLGLINPFKKDDKKNDKKNESIEGLKDES